MKLHLYSIVLFATAAAAYHRTVGIPAAAAIWKLEEGVSCSTRITHGLYSIKRLHPFFGGLIISLASNATSVCGSTLLTSTKVVTAGHCCKDSVEHAVLFTVVLGSVKLFSGGTRVVTDQFLPHYAYNPVTVQNDIAILTVPKVEFTSLIKPIALPYGDLLNGSYVGLYGRVVGYGKTSQTSNIVQSQSLRFAFVSVIPNDECSMYGKYFTDSMICSSAVFGGPCGGDSGGPLFVYGKRDLNKYLIGIVSYGSPLGCNAGRPTVYTKVSCYMDWIYSSIY